jgi:7-carboxy-7-deazaguanine synthase
VQGNNPIRPPAKGDGSRLEVKQLFPTLQGEGPYTGHPAVFVRLGGCNLACHFCDTDFENFATHGVEDVVANVIALAEDAQGNRVRRLVVITGGEPLRQNIAPLCGMLQEEGFKIQIETNGTLYRPLPEGVDIICSPKNTGQGYSAVRDDVLQRATALKFIISKHDERYNHVADVGQSRYGVPVYVQPMDEHDDGRNMENRNHAITLAERHGYILSLQTHKILGIE